MGESLTTKAEVIESEWLGRPAPDVAPDLIGCTLVRTFPDGIQMRGLIVETEAYAPGDPAFHAYRGRSDRNWVVFEAPGHVYVYFIYGMYHCFNIVTDVLGTPSAVLVRALQLEAAPHGLTLSAKQLDRLAAGPGKLCRVLQIDRSHNAQRLEQNATLWLEHRSQVWQQNLDAQQHKIIQTTRIGLTKGMDIPWRWYLSNCSAVSKKLPQSSLA
jgi:DNA-3-methyladenine glycosylase